MNQQSDKRVRIFAHPFSANSFIVIKSFGLNAGHHISAYIGTFSRQDATLRLAVKKFEGDKKPPALSPGKGVLYLELKSQDPLGDPIQLRFITSEKTPRKLVHLFDARNSSETTAYSITRLESDTEYEGFFEEVSRLETQITLKPGEVRTIEVPVNTSGKDWRVWLRGGPADERLPEHWTPVIGFYDHSSKPIQEASDSQLSQAIRALGLSQKRRPQADGLTTRESMGKTQDETATKLPPLVDPLHKVKPGDVLAIFVPGVLDKIDFNFSGAGSGYPIHVKSDGMISLASVGRFKVAGKTAIEIENEVKKKYVDGSNPILKEEGRNSISVVVQQTYEPAARPNPGRGLISLVNPMHQVRAGDVLSVFVPHVFDDLDRSPTSSGYPIHVKSDGKIALPLIGRLKAAGKTALEIENEVKKKYTDGPDPIFLEDYRDSISVIVQQVYKPSAKSKIEASKKSLAELTSDFARAETALEMGRESCANLIRILEEEGKIEPGQVTVKSNF